MKVIFQEDYSCPSKIEHFLRAPSLALVSNWPYLKAFARCSCNLFSACYSAKMKATRFSSQIVEDFPSLSKSISRSYLETLSLCLSKLCSSRLAPGFNSWGNSDYSLQSWIAFLGECTPTPGCEVDCPLIISFAQEDFCSHSRVCWVNLW